MDLDEIHRDLNVQQPADVNVTPSKTANQNKEFDEWGLTPTNEKKQGPSEAKKPKAYIGLAAQEDEWGDMTNSLGVKPEEMKVGVNKFSQDEMEF